MGFKALRRRKSPGPGASGLKASAHLLSWHSSSCSEALVNKKELQCPHVWSGSSTSTEAAEVHGGSWECQGTAERPADSLHSSLHISEGAWKFCSFSFVYAQAESERHWSRQHFYCWFHRVLWHSLSLKHLLLQHQPSLSFLLLAPSMGNWLLQLCTLVQPSQHPLASTHLCSGGWGRQAPDKDKADSGGHLVPTRHLQLQGQC